jgi:dihydrodipicolinate synthase/N-acetylneuraminate lyase
MEVNWKGFFQAQTAKYDGDEKVDIAALETDLNAQLNAGVNGIILGGSLGRIKHIN